METIETLVSWVLTGPVLADLRWVWSEAVWRSLEHQQWRLPFDWSLKPVQPPVNTDRRGVHTPAEGAHMSRDFGEAKEINTTVPANSQSLIANCISLEMGSKSAWGLRDPDTFKPVCILEQFTLQLQLRQHPIHILEVKNTPARCWFDF